MLYLVGLGLHDERDISIRGLDALKASDKIYVEFYTNKFNGNLENLEKIIGKSITVLDRKEVEEDKPFIQEAKDGSVSLLIVGDPLAATTHSEIMLEANKNNIGVKVIHSSSIFTAVAEIGLQLYKFGRTTTLAFPEGDYFPTSPYDVIRENLNMGLHTLVLLDIKDDIGRYMSVNYAIGVLTELEGIKKEGIIKADTTIIGASRLGGNPVIGFGPAIVVQKHNFGDPPHILIVPSKLHFQEEEALLKYTL